MPLTPIELWRGTLRDRFGRPFEREKPPEPEDVGFLARLWRGLTPWKEEKGETLGTAWQGLMGTSFLPESVYKDPTKALTWGGALGQMGELGAGLSVAVPGAIGLRAALAPAIAKGGARGAAAQVAKTALAPVAGAERAIGAVGKGISRGVGAMTKPIGSRVAPAVTPKPLTPREQATDKLFRVLKIEKPALRETEALRHVERTRRGAMMERAAAKGEPEAALARAGKLRAGKYPTAQTPIRERFSKEEASELFGTIRDSNLRIYDKAKANDAFVKLLYSDQPLQKGEIALLGEVFGPKFVSAYETLGRKVVKGLLDVANLPRAVIASADLSATLRQGGILLARRPYLGPGMLKAQIKSFFSKNELQKLDDIIRADKDFVLFNELGGYMAPLPGKTTQLWKAEEAFMTRFARKIPLIAQSERAFIGGLNYLRFNSFKHGLKLFRKLGATSERDLRGLVKLINIASGRGDWKLLRGDIGPLASAILFSPRLQLAKLQLPAMLLPKSAAEIAHWGKYMTPVRKEAWRTMIQFLGFGAGILSMAKLAGAKIEMDPRSTDFGKIKMGETRADIWTGFAQYARFASQFLTSERKEARGGAIRELQRTGVIGRFIQSKFSPGAGLVYDILAGRTYMGEELSFETESLRRQAFYRLTPLFFQDMIDATAEEGLMGSLFAAPAFLGVGMVTHRPGEAPILRKAKPGEISFAEASRMAYQDIEARVWGNYPSELRRISDEIKKLENGDEAEQVKAKRMLMQYPAIMMARKLIALEKKRWQATNKRLYKT